MTGVVLDWISCFMRERTQRIVFDGQLSTTQHLAFGVPQGSVLGPLIYVLYTAELSCVVAEHGLRLHQYADDSQIYISVALRDATHAVQRFTDCVSDISDWMSASRLRLNPTKMEVMWLGSNRQLGQITIIVIPLQSAIVRVSESARDLGIVLDCKLSMSERICALPIWFLPPTTTPTSDQIADTSSCPDSSPDIYIVSP